MSDYTKSTNFAAKDALASGNAAKVVKGTEIDTEFNNIATAIATKADTTAVDLKADIASPAFTGNPTAPTPTAGDNDTSIATTAFVTTAVAALGYPAFKNRIINGAMVIDQRNAGASVTINTLAGGYTLDRWFATGKASAGVFTVQRLSASAPAGFTNYLACTTTTSATPGATDAYVFGQFIEGFNVADLGWGSANAQSVTLSFKVYSSLTGTFGGSVANNAANRCYPFSFSVASANTWTTVSVTIAGDTTGTWTTDNTAGLKLYFDLGSGSSLRGTAGSWGATFYTGVTGAQSMIATGSATFYITGVQLEKGSTATSFDYRPYGTELALCQRYYYRLKAGSAYANAGIGRAYSTANGQAVVAMPVSMRAAPTGGYSALSDWNAAQASGNITALSPAAQYSLDYRQMTIDITATMVSGQTVILNANNTTNAWIDWSAEL